MTARLVAMDKGPA